jgi:hypothetical protein
MSPMSVKGADGPPGRPHLARPPVTIGRERLATCSGLKSARTCQSSARTCRLRAPELGDTHASREGAAPSEPEALPLPITLELSQCPSPELSQREGRPASRRWVDSVSVSMSAAKTVIDRVRYFPVLRTSATSARTPPTCKRPPYEHEPLPPSKIAHFVPPFPLTHVDSLG